MDGSVNGKMGLEQIPSSMDGMANSIGINSGDVYDKEKTMPP